MPSKTFYILEKRHDRLFDLLPSIVEIANLEKEALGFIPEAGYREAVARGRLIAMVAQTERQIEVAGFILFSGVFPHATVQQVAVASGYRRTGMASALINGLVSELERVGFISIKANVASNLPNAQAFYERNGFEAIRERAGGTARNRRIIVRVRVLDTDHFFSPAAESEIGKFKFRKTPKGKNEAFYTLDLNVFLDLAKNRARYELASKLFGAALSHRIRLAVASEFLRELQRNTTGLNGDPVLQMALQLPRLPPHKDSDLQPMVNGIHALTFTEQNSRQANSPQAWSDCKHLAHAAKSQSAGFVTSDNTILASRNALLARYGLDIISLEELAALLPADSSEFTLATEQGNRFEVRAPSDQDLRSFLRSEKVETNLISEFADHPLSEQQHWGEAIFDGAAQVAVACMNTSASIENTSRLLVQVRPEHLDREIFADYLIDKAIRAASVSAPAAVELAHSPGQATVKTAAKQHGFVHVGRTRDLIKIAAGKPITAQNWPEIVHQIRRRTGITLPDKLKIAADRRTMTVTNDDKTSFEISIDELEAFLSPTVIVWPGRNGVVVPIAKNYADELLGTAPQMLLSFIEKRDASFLSRRTYVNSPRTAKAMQPGSPILFYESKRSGNGRGAIVAVARIEDAVIAKKSLVSNSAMKRVVVDDVGDFSSSDDVLMTTFSSLLPLPRPVSLKTLRSMKATGKANLITATKLTSGAVTRILDAGWSRG